MREAGITPPVPTPFYSRLLGRYLCKVDVYVFSSISEIYFMERRVYMVDKNVE